ncbi:MAG TPA: hypothetical protein PLF32_09395 [Bacteroidales bacterium]|jgi:serine kinase of HPr protein (carbohydrate metabolism regulator)|nr:hypothetical protein [Bacteroidales bacterium]HOF17082.1 hypothetical protein [Bacteroidales bacterium]HOR82854.1 hypothetical protein [Bacteroidales bacterium]HPJ92105.1 hypothetical protein [Bacteroidales bacterium]HPX59428.1 hypothetical protein [Bacteroidales bacterium]
MTIKEIAESLEGEIVCSEKFTNRKVEKAFSSDLMSEVLTIDSENLILITGLVNVQTIRTCEMLDIQNIIIVRNKKATPEMLELAEENDIIIIQCPFSMFKASGILYQHGIKPIY